MPKASCWSRDAKGIPQPLGGRFRVTGLAQLREIAAEKETTCKKNKGWIYSWGATEVMRVET